jgi:hypothetical protein
MHLADIRDMVLIGMEDQHWLDTDFLPRATAAGFRGHDQAGTLFQ